MSGSLPAGIFRPNAGFFPTLGHEESLARALYVVEHRRRLALIHGPQGVGKTRLLRELRRQVAHPECVTVEVDAAGFDSAEWGPRLAEACGCVCERQDAWNALRDLLVGWSAAQIRSVWLIDHADQSEGPAWRWLLRLVRLLDQTRTTSSVLITTRSLDDCAEVIDLSDFVIEVPAWTADDVRAYVEQGLSANDWETVFTPTAIQAVFDCSGGVPQIVQRLCEFVLLACEVDRILVVEASLIIDVWSECATSTTPRRQLAGNRR